MKFRLTRGKGSPPSDGLPQERERKGPAKSVLLYSLFVAAAYAFIIYVFVYLCNKNNVNFKINNIIDICKACSLGMIIIAGGELALHETDRSKLVKNLNRFSLAVVLVLLILILMEVFLFSLDTFLKLDLETPSVRRTFLYDYCIKPLVFWSALPIALYTTINLISSYSIKNTDNNSPEKKAAKARAWNVFMLADWPVAFPLLCAIVLIWYLKINDVELPKGDRDLFLSGGMAIILLSSAISTKAVNEYIT